MFSNTDCNNISRSMNAHGSELDPEITFNLDTRTLSIQYEYKFLSQDDTQGSCDTFELGENLISFLEIDFKKYNKLLDHYEKEHEKISTSSPFRSYFNDYYAILDKHSIYHPYFEVQNFYSNSDSFTPKEFAKYMAIDLEKIEFLKNFLLFLSGTPCKNLGGEKYNASPLPSSETPSVDKKTDFSSRGYLAAIMYELFSKTPMMNSRLYCELQIDDETNIIQKYVSGCRYASQHPLSFAVTELSKMIESGITIKQCKNCGFFFIPPNNHATDYCNRPYKKTGKTCKEVGANRKYKEKVYKNPILQEYERAYKRNYAKCKRNAIDAETFRQWIDEATLERDRVVVEYENSNDITILKAFKKYLGNK